MSNLSKILDWCRRELVFELMRASGPGGQNVNKVSTALQLRFDIARSAALNAGAKSRLTHLGGRRVTTDGVLVIRAGQYRTQALNRRDAIQRFSTLLEQALASPKRRHATVATAASRERRLQAKKRRGDIKRKRTKLAAK